jgi:hydroxyacylglutathione hydrolase
MKVTDGLYAFLRTSISANNCNTYLIDGPAKILIDPDHFEAVKYLKNQPALFGISLEDWRLIQWRNPPGSGQG